MRVSQKRLELLSPTNKSQNGYLRLIRSSPALAGISFAIVGSVIWFLLEQGAIFLGAGSQQLPLDGMLVLLLSMQLGYFVAALPLLRAAGQRCIAELRPLLDYSDPAVVTLIKRFDTSRPPVLRITFIVGACLTVFLQELQFARFSQWLAQPDFALGEIWTVLTAWATWSLGLAATIVVVTDAAAMRHLGRDHVSVDLMRIEQLTGFSRYGLQLATTVIGLMALWAVSLVLISPFVGPDLAEKSRSIGLFLVLVYVTLAITVFSFPQLGIRERIRTEKARICNELTNLLPSSRDIVEQVDANPSLLAGPLTARAMIQDVPEWPAGQLTQLRLAFYLLVPLLSWSAAALVEEIISRMLTN
ncbi:MAG: hypothetical protein R3E64_02000 [Halioglobus sp.]